MNYEIINIPQNTPEWYDFRKNHLGSSDIPIVLGISPYVSPYGLYMQKMGLSEGQQETPNMAFGKDQEESIRQYINGAYGYNLKPIVAVSKRFPWLSASLDGWDDGEAMILEIKCNNQVNHSLALKSKLCDHHFAQIQAQMLVMGQNRAMYCSRWMDETHETIVHEDIDYQNEIINKSREFYHSMIDFTPPPLTDKDYIKRDELEWQNAAQGLKEAQAKKEWWEAEEKEQRQKLIEMAAGQPCIGAGIKLSKVISKGKVSYNQIPELSGVNLDKYRGESQISWRITKVNE